MAAYLRSFVMGSFRAIENYLKNDTFSELSDSGILNSIEGCICVFFQEFFEKRFKWIHLSSTMSLIIIINHSKHKIIN